MFVFSLVWASSSQTFELEVVWDAISLMWTRCNALLILLFFAYTNLTLTSRRCGCYLKSLFLKLIFRMDNLNISWDIFLCVYFAAKPRWSLLNIGSVNVIAWCCQATSHYLSQSWPRTFVTIAPSGHNENDLILFFLQMSCVPSWIITGMGVVYVLYCCIVRYVSYCCHDDCTARSVYTAVLYDSFHLYCTVRFILLLRK